MSVTSRGGLLSELSKGFKSLCRAGSSFSSVGMHGQMFARLC